MSINNREDANKYYKIVNELVDDFIVSGKIKPSNLKRYLSPEKKMESFLKKNNLSSIDGIKKVVKDVIDSRYNMESDGVMKFESFKLFESEEYNILTLGECITKGINKTNIDEEKFLADYFDTNLGHIDVINTERHIYKVNAWEKELEVIIYSKEDFDIIKGNIIEFMMNDFNKKDVLLTTGLKINLSDIVDTNKLNTILYKIFDIEKTSDVIISYLGKEYSKIDLTDYILFLKD